MNIPDLYDTYNRLGKCTGRSRVLRLTLSFIYRRIPKTQENSYVLGMLRTAMRDAKSIQQVAEIIK
jgi:hypothetical protein